MEDNGVMAYQRCPIRVCGPVVGTSRYVTGVAAWPPCRQALDAFTFFFRHGPTLSRYVSHIRSTLRLVGSPLGVLADTSSLLRGSMKWSAAVRYKPRADAEQTRALARFARKEVGRGDIADSWVVARHFCLRYGAEVVPMESAGTHSAISIGTSKELPVLTLTLFHRKLQQVPVMVVRRCICKLQGRALCGVCILQSRYGGGQVFPGLSYVEGLAYLKAGATQLKFERAAEWGTHAFRRGWANESLKAGGPTALFYSVGWRGVAAFSYVAAQSRGAMEAAEWLVEFSDSSEGESLRGKVLPRALGAQGFAVGQTSTLGESVDSGLTFRAPQRRRIQGVPNARRAHMLG